MPRQIVPRLPGLALVIGLALAATMVQRLIGIGALSPLVLAMILGVAIRNTMGRADALRPGIAFALKPVLRFAIVLLGFQITLGEVVSLGWQQLVAVALTLIATFLVTRRVGRWLGVEAKLAELIAAGTAVCGASAIVATNSVTRAREEDVAYAMACVTLFGTVSMLLYPLLAAPLGLNAELFGLWSGASIHEVAQVVGTAFALGDPAGEAGTIAKLARVMLLAPLVLTLGAMSRGTQTDGAKVPTPWFVFGFIAVMLRNSAVPLPDAAMDVLRPGTAFLMTMALAAMGLETDLARLRLKGLRPLALGAFGWLFIAGFGLVAVSLAAV